MGSCWRLPCEWEAVGKAASLQAGRGMPLPVPCFGRGPGFEETPPLSPRTEPEMGSQPLSLPRLFSSPCFLSSPFLTAFLSLCCCASTGGTGGSSSGRAWSRGWGSVCHCPLPCKEHGLAARAGSPQPQLTPLSPGPSLFVLLGKSCSALLHSHGREALRTAPPAAEAGRVPTERPFPTLCFHTG